MFDEALGKLRAAGGGGFIVVVNDANLVSLSAYGDATRGVDALDGKVVAVFRVDAVGGVFTREGDCRAEDDRVSLDLGLSRSGNGQPQGGRTENAGGD